MIATSSTTLPMTSAWKIKPTPNCGSVEARPQLDGVHVKGDAEVIVKDCDLTANGRNGFQSEEGSRAELYQCRVRPEPWDRGRLGGAWREEWLSGCEVTGNGAGGASIGPKR